MAVSSLREQLISSIDQLSDAEIEMLLRYIDAMHRYTLPADYDPTKDPVVNGEGWLSGEPDLASRTGDILYSEFGLTKS